MPNTEFSNRREAGRKVLGTSFHRSRWPPLHTLQKPSISTCFETDPCFVGVFHTLNQRHAHPCYSEQGIAHFPKLDVAGSSPVSRCVLSKHLSMILHYLSCRCCSRSCRMRLAAADARIEEDYGFSAAISLPPGLQRHQAGACTALSHLLEDLVAGNGAAGHRKFSTRIKSDPLTARVE